jgi:hypothetical protein
MARVTFPIQTPDIVSLLAYQTEQNRAEWTFYEANTGYREDAGCSVLKTKPILKNT